MKIFVTLLKNVKEVAINTTNHHKTPGSIVVVKSFTIFLHYLLVPSLEKINIGNAGNQNHPDLEVRVVLVTCISNIDF